MEYSSYSRSLAWYWVLAYSLYGAAVIAGVFFSNPYLYSNSDLKTHLAEKKETAPHPFRLNAHSVSAGKISTVSAEKPIGRRFVEADAKPLLASVNKELKNPSFLLDGKQVFAVAEGPWLWAADLDGKEQWRFRLADSETFQPVADEALVYLASESGRVIALDRGTGHPQWMLKFKEEVVAAPLLVNDRIYVLAREDGRGEGFQLFSIAKASGEALLESAPLFDKGLSKDSFSLAASESQNLLLAGRGIDLYGLELKTLKNSWKVKLEKPVAGSPVIADDRIYLGSPEGVVTALSSTGEVRWKTALDAKILAGPVYIPQYKRLAVFLEGKIVQLIDTKKGEKLWRFNTETENGFSGMWTQRLNTQSMEELKLKWVTRGWTLFVPCLSQRICLLNPDNGQVLGHISLSNTPEEKPLVTPDKTLYFVLRDQKTSALSIAEVIDKSAHTKKLSDPDPAKPATSPAPSAAE